MAKAILETNTRRRNLAGQTFGHLKVIGFAGNRGKRAYWKFVCVCGETVVRRTDGLVSGSSCGCGLRYFIGAKIRMLTLVSKTSRTSWRCLCECGSECERKQRDLRPARGTKSCGCLIERHGATNSPEYKSYRHAKGRCNNPRNAKFKDYGGRNVKFLYTSYKQFIEDVGLKPSPSHSIDRIWNDGNYEPSNCKWSTPTEQARNRRITFKVEYQGIVKPLAQWCDDLGIEKRQMVYNRIKHLGWSVERAFETPSMSSLS